MINAETLVTARGSGFITSVFGAWNMIAAVYGDISTAVGLDIFELWNFPNTSPLFEQGQVINGFADVHLEAGRLYWIPIGNDVTSVNVLQTLNPRHNEFFIVPRNGSVAFQVFVTFFTFVSAADMFDLPPPFIAAGEDFTLPAFDVQCPFVHLEAVAIPITS
jgi:hypothetical protein